MAQEVGWRLIAKNKETGLYHRLVAKGTEALGEAEELILKLRTGVLHAVADFPLRREPFSDEEVAACKVKILREIDANEKVFPSDVSIKYDLDYCLVASCFELLAREEKIAEAEKSETHI